MSGDKNTGKWSVLKPSAWPEAPTWMSFTTLLGLEACPRRWALSIAEYPSVWNKRGYPRPLQPAALEGTIVHLSLQKVMAKLVERGYSSLYDGIAIAALRELGGFTGIVLNSVEQVLQSYEGNPRAAAVLDVTRHRLAARVPELRTKVQRFLTRILPESPTGELVKLGGHLEEPSRRQLSDGTYAEVELRAGNVKWHGIADLLTISSTRCEIRDFKTGASKQEHEFQLQVYALLWARDSDLNPDGRLANRLVLSYDEGDVEMPALTEEELHHLEHELRRRTTQALADLQLDPPQARPSPQNCAYCSVRHLCEEYWPWHARHGLDSGLATTGFGDAQIQITGQHGPSSWDGVVESGLGLKAGGSVLVRTANSPLDLHPSQRLRLLNVHYIISNEEPNAESELTSAVLMFGSLSEAYILS